MDHQEIYIRLGRLIEVMPKVQGSAGDSRETMMWLARANALLSYMNMVLEASRLAEMSVRMSQESFRDYDYTEEAFLRAVSERGRVVESRRASENGRLLVWYQRG